MSDPGHIIGYVRVSGKSQVEGDGPERQQEAIHRFIFDNWQQSPLAIVQELAVSGTVEGMDRPELAAMLEQHDKGVLVFGALVIERMDRLARDLMVQEFIIRELKKRGIKLFCADQGPVDVCDDESDPTRKLIRQILGALAEWEKSCIVKKLASARARIRAETGRCGGTPPYGTRPGESKTLNLIKNLRAEGASLRTIVQILNREGLVTRSGREWDKSRVLHILQTVKRKESFVKG